MHVLLPFVFLNYFDLVSRFHLYKPESFRVLPFANIDDINERGMQPVHLAVENGNFQATRTLIETFGALPTAVTRRDDKSIPKGSTPFIISIIKNNLEIFVYLLSKTTLSLLELCDEQLKTPLHYAAQFGNPMMVEAILDKTKKIGLLRQTRMSPLHLALAGGHVKVVKLFAEFNLGFGPVMGPNKNRGASSPNIGLLESTLFYLARQKLSLEIWTQLWAICTQVLGKSDAFSPHMLTKKTLLDVALEEENDEIAAILILLGANLKRHVDANMSSRHRGFFIEIVEFYGAGNEIDPTLHNESRNNDSIWHICARHNALFFVKALMHHFPDLEKKYTAQPDAGNVLALEIAVENVNDDLAVELVKFHGHTIESSVLESLVCSAALGSQYRLLEALINQFPLEFANLMSFSENVRPLHLLVTTALSQPKEGHKEIVLLFLKKYPYALSIHDRLGRTPLHLALECNFIDFYVWLREAKGLEGFSLDFDVQNQDGYSFLKYLQDENYSDILKILK